MHLTELDRKILTWLRGLGSEPDYTYQTNIRSYDQAARKAAEALKLPPDTVRDRLLALEGEGRVEIVPRRGFSGIYYARITDEGRQELRQPSAATPEQRPIIFVSCGQSTDEERALGAVIVDILNKETQAEAYYAEYQATFEGVSSHILESLSRCAGFVGIMHYRGLVKEPNGTSYQRASVWVEQEIAIASYRINTLKEPMPVQLYIQRGIKREGLRDKVMLNPISFDSNDEVVAHFRSIVRERFGGLTKAEEPLQMTAPVSTYATEIRETLSEAHGQGGLMIPTFICSMSLAVHPSVYAEDRFTEDRERSIVCAARDSLHPSFPRLGPESAANLDDGFEVIPDWNVVANRRVREYYRFRRDGLFVFVCASPDDIGEDLQYRQQDRYIGFGTLVATLTNLMLFAAALARQYGDETTASISVRGLMNHRLVDDLADKPLTLASIRPAHQDVVGLDFRGSPGEFEQRKLEWAAETIAQCLRALNYPATAAVAKEQVRVLQARVL